MSPSSSSRKPVAAADTDTIPMKGVSPLWYAIFAGVIVVALAIVVAIKLNNRNSAAAERGSMSSVSVESRWEEAKLKAAEARQHLEITQRSLERLKETQSEKKAQEAAPAAEPEPRQAQPVAAAPVAGPRGTPTSARAPTARSAPTATSAPTAAPAPTVAAAAPKGPSRTQKKTLDKLDSISSDIASQLGK